MEACSPDCRSNVENAPVAGRSAAPISRMLRAVLGRRSPAGRRPTARADPAQPAVRTICRHIAGWTQACIRVSRYVAIATQPVPIANPPNSAQLGGSLYHAPKLHPGLCSSVGVWPRTDRQTDTQTRVTTIHFASSTTHAKCKYHSITV